MSSRLVLLERTATGAVITLNRPERSNSLVPDLLTQLRVSLLEASEEGAPIVLTAAGPTFSTGGDLGGFWAHRDSLASYAADIVGQLNDVIVTMLTLPSPIVTPVHGMVTGGSMGLVLASDVVLVSPEATFRPWYGAVGFSPDGGWTALLPELIGRRRARAVVLADETITAEQAVAWGLATELVPADDLQTAATRYASQLAAQQAGTVHHAKELLADDLDAVRARLESEREHFLHQIVTAEAVDGMARFLGVD